MRPAKIPVWRRRVGATDFRPRLEIGRGLELEADDSGLQLVVEPGVRREHRRERSTRSSASF